MATKAQRRRKRIRQQKRALYDPSALLSGGSLRQAARTIANLQFTPAIQAKAREISGLGTTGNVYAGKVGSAYGQLASSMAQNITAVEAAGAQHRANVQSTNTAAQQRMQQIKQQTAQVGDQFKSDPNQAALLAQQMAAREQRQAGMEQAYTQNAGAQTAASADYARKFAAAVAARGTEAQGDIHRVIAQRIGLAQGELSDLRGQRSNARVKALLDLRSGERDYGLAQQTLGANMASDQAKLALEGQKLSETTRHNIASESNESQRLAAQLLSAKSNAAKNKALAQIYQYNLKHPKNPIGARGATAKGEKQATPVQRANNRKAWDKYVNWLKQGGQIGSFDPVQDPALGKIVQRYLKNKKLGPKDIRKLHKRWPGVLTGGE